MTVKVNGKELCALVYIGSDLDVGVGDIQSYPVIIDHDLPVLLVTAAGTILQCCSYQGKN